MVVTPFRLFLFAVAAFLAAGGTAYYTGALDAYFAPASRQVAQEEEGQGGGSAAPESGQPAADTAKADAPKDAAGGEESSASASAQETGKQADKRIVVPAFDIVRVEPDGSMVVAGRAAPKSNVEVVSGSTIVGKTKSGPEGDFAVVLDKPLQPGSHQIVLRSTSPQDVVATSKETAIVSVPETENGKVLALVEEPGKPSRLITKPDAEAADAKNEVAQAGKAETAEAGEAAKKADAQAPAASGNEAKGTRPQIVMTEPAEDTGKDAGAASTGGSVATGQEASGAAPGSAAPADGEPGASATRDTAAATGEAAQGLARTAASDPAADEASQADKEAERGDVKVFIEAVEIDGDDIFVAGGGVPGQRVRVYANDILLGDAVVSPNGRFLVQTSRDLPVGDYIVRADLLSDSGAEVVARAAVPFDREPGEKLAAVAPKSERGPASEPAGDEEPAAAAEASAGDRTMESGSEASTAAPRTASNPPQGEDEREAASGSGENVAASADGAAESAASRGQMAAADAEGGMELPDLDNGLAESAPVITGPKLETVDGAVIIRRGDTLWQISRRVYGRGVRYSTIYLANQQQIRDPDMIWPGQVFSVPQETKDGEAADMKAIGEQAVPADMAGTEPEWRR